MNVIDAGVAVLNMHAPMEIVSKVDVYEAYLAYRTFLNKFKISSDIFYFGFELKMINHKIIADNSDKL